MVSKKLTGFDMFGPDAHSWQVKDGEALLNVASWPPSTVPWSSLWGTNILYTQQEADDFEDLKHLKPSNHLNRF